MNSYEEIEMLVDMVFVGSEEEKSYALEKIVLAYRPLLIRLMKKYYSRYDEDILQDATIELIQKTLDYDYKSYNRFSAYIKTFMCLYYKRTFINYINEKNSTSYEEADEKDSISYDIYDVEIKSVLEVLDEKESIIVEKHILQNETLKNVSKTMNISYAYAKKIKTKALKTLKQNIKKEDLWKI